MNARYQLTHVIDPRNPDHLFIDKPRPTQLLDKEGTLALLAAPPADFLARADKWSVKSHYLCDFMDRMEAESGFVYNTQALRAFEAAHDLPPSDENGSVLSLLIYNAQGYRRADALVAEGWRPGSELLAKARPGDKIRIKGSNILGGDVHEVLTVREIGGCLYAMRPHKRKYAVGIASMPCKPGADPVSAPTSNIQLVLV